MADWYLSCQYATAWVQTRGGIIVDTAPIWRRVWVGKSLAALCEWLKYYHLVRLGEGKDD